MKARHMTMTIEFAPRTGRKVEHAVGEAQTAVLDAITELRPVALRLDQRKQALDAAAVTSSIMALQIAAKRLAKLTKYAEE